MLSSRICRALVLSSIAAFSGPLEIQAQQVPTESFRAILKAQDLRDSESLKPYMSDPNPAVRQMAAFACASVQDPSLIDTLGSLLKETDAGVRGMAALALGQLNYVVDSVQRAHLSNILTERVGLETHRHTLMRVIEALGKVGNDYAMLALTAVGETSPAPDVKSAVALSIGRFAYRGIKSKVATEYAVSLLSPTFIGEHWKAAYALMRINDADLFLRNEEGIMQGASHPDPDARMFIASAMGKIAGMPAAANALLSLAMSDPDWRVRVNAIKSLAGSDSSTHSRVLPAMFRLAADSNEHVSITSLNTLGEMRLIRSPFGLECRKVLVEIMTEAKFSQRQKREAAIALGKMLGTEGYPVLAEQYRRERLTPHSYAASLANVYGPDAFNDLIRLLEGRDALLKRIALESIRSSIRYAERDVRRRAKEQFLGALQSKDMPVIATAAGALGDSLLLADDSLEPLTSALRRLRTEKDPDGKVAIIQTLAQLNLPGAIAPLESALKDADRQVGMEAAKALKKLTGKSHEHLVRKQSAPAYTDFDWVTLEEIKKNPVVTVRTSAGTFSFMLLPEESPFTTINFAKLIKKKFFDGLQFHRVVPNFVIQGGDPRGDGWGGPGYSIRSEFGKRHYLRGIVGVASSGKDTEGCQWFVTHCSTPHLDGRYTIFGEITAGMDVVDKIQVGDTILSMRIGR